MALTSLEQETLHNFAETMGIQLYRDENKLNWRSCTIDYLFVKLKEKVKGLEDTINRKPEDVMWECADIANFAMMIDDLYDYNYR